jgi:plastocyanin
MRLILLSVLAATAVLAAAALALGAQGRPQALPVLVAKTGFHNANKITLQTPAGKPVTSILAGTYAIVVHDYSTTRNFVLRSVTESRRIFTGSISGVGTKTYKVTLDPGKYAYSSSTHFQTMHGSFVVTAPAATTTEPAPTTLPVLVAKTGFDDSFTITLETADGMPVTSIPAGQYSIVVHDYSKIHNFALGSVTQNTRIFTGSISGVGTETYTVTLTPGVYAYACSAHFQTMHGTFVVTAAP